MRERSGNEKRNRKKRRRWMTWEEMKGIGEKRREEEGVLEGREIEDRREKCKI